MSEFEVSVVAVRVHFRCDKCGMEPKYEGLMLASQPPKYVHECVCGESYRLPCVYPKIVHREAAPREVVQPGQFHPKVLVLADEQKDPNVLHADVIGAAAIADACKSAHRIAIERGLPVGFEFNGFWVQVDQRDDPMKVAAGWWKMVALREQAQR